MADPQPSSNPPDPVFAGRAATAAGRLLGRSMFLVLGIIVTGWIATALGSFLTAASGILAGIWVCFAGFTLWFFRDPDPRVPSEPGLFVAPGHGKVDLVDQVEEPVVLGGRCHRVSIFLSVFDVHVQNAPETGRLIHRRHQPGLFLNALKTECADQNEHVMLGWESPEDPQRRFAVKLIAGLIARRILPWVQEGSQSRRGDRISLIQFGSRVNLYLPLDCEILVAPGMRVRGGETVIGRLSDPAGKKET